MRFVGKSRGKCVVAKRSIRHAHLNQVRGNSIRFELYYIHLYGDGFDEMYSARVREG